MSFLRSAARRTKQAVDPYAGPFLNAILDRMPGADREIFELRPFELHLEFTNLCNANCVFCPYSIQTRPHERMSEAIFKKAVADFVAIGGGSVDLTPTVGDPLIHPQFVEWVRYMRAIPAIDRITVTTNAILVDRYGAEAILDCGLSRINVSIAGFDEAMYRRIYRNENYKKVLRNVTDLLRLNSERAEPIPIFLCVRPDRPLAEVMQAPDLQPLLQYHPKFDIAQTYSRVGGLINELPEGMTLEPVRSKSKTVPCYQTYTGLMVQSTGDVQLCPCVTTINAPGLLVGNIERESLSDIWLGDRVRQIRQSFRDGTLNSNCRNCDYHYGPAEFHTSEMRKRARSSRLRHAGIVVHHTEPVTEVWQME